MKTNLQALRPLATCIAVLVPMGKGTAWSDNPYGSLHLSPEQVAEQERDLLVLSMTLPRYQVHNLPVTAALKAIWTTATGNEPSFIGFAFEPEKGFDPLISLDLKDTPVTKIVGYVSELAASHWTLDGVYGAALTLRVEPIKAAICRESVNVGTWDVSKTGAKLLGLKAGMKSSEVKITFARFGCQWEDWRGDLGALSGDATRLVVVSLPAETSFVGALVRLANAGMKIEKTGTEGKP